MQHQEQPSEHDTITPMATEEKCNTENGEIQMGKRKIGWIEDEVRRPTGILIRILR
jgi:hypothetical protein